jgi:DNA polymerase-3 subunit alpha
MPGTLVFDVETTGLPIRESMYRRFPSPKNYHAFDHARVVELAYKVFDAEHTLVKAVSVLVKPDRFEIENSDIHGIKHETAEQYGSRIDFVLANFLIDVDNCDTLVSHNMEFDLNIMLSEIWRIVLDPQEEQRVHFNYLDVQTLVSANKVCTMKTGQTRLNLVKYPKLVDLFHTLCDRRASWKQSHRALDDVDKCAQCYFKLVSTPIDHAL